MHPSSHTVDMPKTEGNRNWDTSSNASLGPKATQPSNNWDTSSNASLGPKATQPSNRKLTRGSTMSQVTPGDQRFPPSPALSAPQVTVDSIVQAYIIAARKIDREPDRQNSKFALFSSFMLMISTGAFVLSFEQAQKWLEELFRQQHSGGVELKKGQTLISVEMALATMIYFVGLIFAMTLMLTGTFSNRDMQRSRFFLFCAWFLVMSTLVSPSLSVVGIVRAAAAPAVYLVLLTVYIVLLVVGGCFAARLLNETYQRSIHED